jgi:hypothetical protein
MSGTAAGFCKLVVYFTMYNGCSTSFPSGLGFECLQCYSIVAFPGGRKKGGVRFDIAYLVKRG